MTNALEGIHSRITEAEAWVNDLEDRTVGITATELNTEKRMKINEDSLRGHLDSIKHTSPREPAPSEGDFNRGGLDLVLSNNLRLQWGPPLPLPLPAGRGGILLGAR